MSTLKERASHLFITVPLDADGRPVDVPVAPTPAAPAQPIVPRVPSPVEVVNFIFSQHHISPDVGAAMDIVASLNELAKIGPGPTGPAPAVPAPPAPQARYTGPERRVKAGVSPTGVERRKAH